MKRKSVRADRQSSQDQSLKRFILYSAIGHGLLFGYGLLKPLLIPSDPLNIKSSIRVDLVALPEKEEKKPAASPPKPAPKVETKKPAEPKAKPPTKPTPEKPKVDLKKSKDTQVDALAKLKQLEALEKLKQQEPEKEVEYKGNVVSEGSSLSGLSQLDFDRYLGAIEDKIRQEWDLPQWLKDSNYRAEATVLIDERGLVIHKQVTRPSGNDIFDDAVLSAIERAAPFPEPPSRLKSVLATRGVVFRFPQ